MKQFKNLSRTELLREQSDRITQIGERNRQIEDLNGKNIKANNEIRVINILLGVNHGQQLNAEKLDYSRYSIDGGNTWHSKSGTILAIAQKYMHNMLTEQEVLADFNPNLGLPQNEKGEILGSSAYGVYRNIKEAEKLNTSGRRFNFEKPFKTSDGIKMVASTQWSVKNFFRVLAVAQKRFFIEIHAKNLTESSKAFAKLNNVKIHEVADKVVRPSKMRRAMPSGVLR